MGSGFTCGCSDCDSGCGLFVRVKLHFLRSVGVERRIRGGFGRKGRGRDVCERDAAFESTDDGDDYGPIAGQYRCGNADDPGGLEAAGDRDDQPVHVLAVAGVSRLLAGWADAIPDRAGVRMAMAPQPERAVKQRVREYLRADVGGKFSAVLPGDDAGRRARRGDDGGSRSVFAVGSGTGGADEPDEQRTRQRRCRRRIPRTRQRCGSKW